MNKTGIRFLTLLLTVALLCSLSVTAFADVIWEPDDSFYQQHSDECTYVDRDYIANGPDGETPGCKSPKNHKIVGSCENGEVLTISYTYIDKNDLEWGLCDWFPTEDGRETVWIPMDYLVVHYDYQSFYNDHLDSFLPDSVQMSEEYCGTEVCLYEYPGSNSCRTMTLFDEAPELTDIYEDEEGHTWGFLGYYYGHQDAWICIDMPVASYDELYPDGGPYVEQEIVPYSGKDLLKDDTDEKETEDEDRDEPDDEESAILGICALAVGIVILVTTALLVIMRKKKVAKLKAEQLAKAAEQDQQ